MTGSDLNDLRAALTARADLHDGGLADRIAGVRNRVARRRRQRIVVSVAAMVLIGAGVVVAGLAGPTDQAGPEPSVTPSGPPEALTVYDYRFDFVRTIEGSDGVAVVTLPSAEQARVVTWATDGDDQRVQVERNYAAYGRQWSPALPHATADWSDWTYIEPGEPIKVRVTAVEGEPTIGVFDLASTRPEGTTVEGVTFRDPAGYRLVDAVVGAPGATSVSLDLDGVEESRRVFVKAFCVGGRGRFEERLLVPTYPDESFFETDCSAAIPDGVAIGDPYSSYGPDALVGREVPVVQRAGQSLRAEYAVRARGEASGARVVLAAWEELPVDVTTRADAVAPWLERDGHGWRLASIVSGGRDGFTTTVPASDTPVLATTFGLWSDRPEDTAAVIGARGGDPDNADYYGPEPAVDGGGTVEWVPGTVVVGTVTGGDPGPGGIGIAFYERVD